MRYGEFRIMEYKIDIFMVIDLEIFVIIYYYDNLDMYSDNIIFWLSDGKYDIKFLFLIIIGFVDDIVLVLMYNIGLILDEGDIVLVD